MTWFAASIVLATHPLDQPDGPYQVQENIVLFEAPSRSLALKKAAEHGYKETIVDDDFVVNGVLAKKHFAGIRKLINILNPYPLDQDEDQPTTGTEITNTTFEIANPDDLSAFTKGEVITLKYID
ncbi:DUF4288 domain-containing protein [Leeia sp. TBRC 13508]|uniref:DUF4288 domain-containing protein n=1 Tax=Leeia speluncae TaxID=2884804 RepID=A0ABS8D9H1_9NEIS|nr:DUF4288 domain-containing protein [Leeia speluncae]MCB6184867.1 DUF4288 domain-containing protein [Leeia speluncae]